METVTVTSKGQITIPAEFRRELAIAEGTRLLVVREDDSLKLTPLPRLSQLAGIDRELFAGRMPSEELLETRKEWTKEFEKRVKSG